MEVKRVWEGGPLRQFAETKVAGNFVRYESPILTGFAGSYVCEQCSEPCQGVYRVRDVNKWLCWACKRAVNAVSDTVSHSR